MNSKLKNIFYKSILVIFFIPAIVSAQQVHVPDEMNMENYYTFLIIIFLIILNAIFIPLLGSSSSVKEIPEAAAEESISIYKKVKDKISGLQPMEEEGNLLMDGNYDGIRELDNNVPPWFNILFYGTILIGVIYFLNFHVFKTGKLPFQEYADEMYAASLEREELIRTGAFINENTVVLLTDRESIDKGKQIFMTNCVTCHGNDAQGLVGPNLTDEYWIHGGGIKNVFTTIKYGVPAKGMITWMNQFNPKMMQFVASYVISIQGTNPPNGKAPEGDKFIMVKDSALAKSDTIKSIASKLDTLKSNSLKPDTSKAADTGDIKNYPVKKDTLRVK